MKIWVNDIKSNGDIIQKEIDCKKDGNYLVLNDEGYTSICKLSNLNTRQRHTEYYDSGILTGFFSKEKYTLSELLSMCDEESHNKFVIIKNKYKKAEKEYQNYYRTLAIIWKEQSKHEGDE